MTSTDLSTVPLTMSSLEIAGLTGKLHRHVLRDADKMLSELQIDGSKFGLVYRDAKGEGRRCLNLPKRECLILVSGYSVEMRARIIDRWMMLEAALTSGAPPAQLSAEETELLRRTDGISRMLSHKVTETEKAVERIEKAIPALINQSIEAIIAADMRRAVLDYASVRQLLDEAKAVQKGRNGVNRKIGFELRMRALISKPPIQLRRCPHSGVWLYPRQFADAYMKESGLQHVKSHNDRVMGQIVMRLVPAKAPVGA